MVDVSKSTTDHTTLTDHEVRIRILERDYAEIKEIRRDVKTLQLDVGSLKSNVMALPAQIETMLRSEIRQHESTEAKQQSRLMWALLSMAVTVIGSALYLVAQHILERLQ
ncbi:MAG: hypothetical protein MZV65_28620 [Chromatiales bacterium]|nr:hypothetical protein [Chromatiales bacterium]